MDIAESTGALKFSLDAHAAECGSVDKLAYLGDAVLRRLVELELRAAAPLRPRFSDLEDRADYPYEAWFLTRDGVLARLYEAVGLDKRMRHLRRPLDASMCALVVRAVVGELEQGIMSAEKRPVVTRSLGPPPPQRRALQQALAAAMLELLRGERGLARASSEPRPLVPSGAMPPQRGVPRSQANDPLLTSILRGAGGVHAAVERCRTLAEAKGPGRLRAAVAAALPLLSERRLRVFVELLSALCQSAPRRGGQAASTAAAVVVAEAAGQAVLDAGLGYLPCETEDQLVAIRRSPYISDELRQALLGMLVPSSDYLAALACGAVHVERDDEVLDHIMADPDSARYKPEAGGHADWAALAAGGASPRFAWAAGDLFHEEASSSATGCTPTPEARHQGKLAPLRSPARRAPTPRSTVNAGVPPLAMPLDPPVPIASAPHALAPPATGDRRRDDAVLNATLGARASSRVGSGRGGCGGDGAGIPAPAASLPGTPRCRSPRFLEAGQKHPSPLPRCGRLADTRTAPLRTSWSVTELGCAASRFRRMAGA